MANFKLVISDPKKAKSEVLEVKDSNAQLFMGRRIGEVVDAASRKRVARPEESSRVITLTRTGQCRELEGCRDYSRSGRPCVSDFVSSGRGGP